METITLNEKQKIALEKIKSGKNIFITGSAGVGKSLVIEHIRKWCRETDKKVMVTATTGVAAASVGGMTFHSWAGIGLGKSAKKNMTDEEKRLEISKRAHYIKRNDKAKERYKQTEILIIDEISMLDYAFVEKVNKIAKDIRKSQRPFGGIQLVLTGDFYQLGPIQKERKKTKYLFEDYVWDELIDESVHLTEVFRQRSLDFVTMLHKIRVGYVDKGMIQKLQSTSENKLENEYGIIPTILFCKNADVNAINIRGVNRLEGKEYNFKSIDTFQDDEIHAIYKNSFTYLEKVTLKVGAQVMLIKNLKIEEGLVNGSRGIVTEIIDDDPIDSPGGAVRVMFTDGNEHLIKPDAQEFKEEQEQHKDMEYIEPVILASRTQFPLKLAYALTVHKAQGLTIDYLHVDLKGAFSPGQAYVALSRATSFDTLKVTNFSKKCVIASKQVNEFYVRIDSGENKKRERENTIEPYFKKEKKCQE